VVLFRRRIRKDWSSNTLLVPFVFFFSGEDSWFWLSGGRYGIYRLDSDGPGPTKNSSSGIYGAHLCTILSGRDPSKTMQAPKINQNPRDQNLIFQNWQGPRERVPPLPQIMTSTLPLGEMVSQRTHQVLCGPLT